MEFHQVAHNSDFYRQAKQLRNAVLRLPLRLILTQDDLAGEALQLHFVASDNGLVVGTVTMKPMGNATVKLRQMAIAESAQGKGVGQKLVALAEQTVKAHGIRMVETHARQTAEPFYKKLGYVPEGQPFTEKTLPHIRMRKAL